MTIGVVRCAAHDALLLRSSNERAPVANHYARAVLRLQAAKAHPIRRDIAVKKLKLLGTSDESRQRRAADCRQGANRLCRKLSRPPISPRPWGCCVVRSPPRGPRRAENTPRSRASRSTRARCSSWCRFSRKVTPPVVLSPTLWPRPSDVYRRCRCR